MRGLAKGMRLGMKYDGRASKITTNRREKSAGR